MPSTNYPLRERAAPDRFKAGHDFKTTLQTFVDGQRIGGCNDLRRWFGLTVRDRNATSCRRYSASHCRSRSRSASPRVPLGFISPTENLLMIAMAAWMIAAPHFGARG